VDPLTATERRIRLGGLLWVLGVLEFVAAMQITQELYGPPTYSVTGNYISDLGAVHCKSWSGGGAFTGDYVCSPAHNLFNGGIIALGILLVAGVLLSYRAFPRPRARWAGLGTLLVSGIGAAGVGVFPEDVDLSAHIAVSITAFVGVNLAVLMLAPVLWGDPRWGRGWAAYSVASGVAGFVALVLFLTTTYGPLGVGGIERLVVVPVLLWAFLVGISMIRQPRVFDGTVPTLPSPAAP
jgi:hypothetical membrane protein